MDQQLAQEVCRVIKQELKKSRAISYQDLANELAVSQVSVKRLLNNAQPMSMQRLIHISRLLDFPLSKLLDRAEKSSCHSSVHR
ncbi:helix-turn-helix domain-containing protein [Vibrio sinaloensis]|nr:helix-turn-helix domain-containing protein [Vibrio sinaloensis]